MDGWWCDVRWGGGIAIVIVVWWWLWRFFLFFSFPLWEFWVGGLWSYCLPEYFLSFSFLFPLFFFFIPVLVWGFVCLWPEFGLAMEFLGIFWLVLYLILFARVIYWTFTALSCTVLYRLSIGIHNAWGSSSPAQYYSPSAHRTIMYRTGPCTRQSVGEDEPDNQPNLNLRLKDKL